MTRPFATFPFPSTGGSANRTMPDRLADIINIKDFGALGNNSANDAPAIQAAIAQAIGPRADPVTGVNVTGGTVFLPPGLYLISSPLTVGHASVDAGVRLIGAGRESCALGFHSGYADTSGFGYTISKGIATNIDCLERVEGIGGNNGGLSVKASRTNFVMNSCGMGQVDASNANGARIECCDGQLGNVSGDAASTTPGCATGLVGFWVGNQGTIINCRIEGFCDIAYALSGNCPRVLAAAVENCNTAVRIGWTPTLTLVTTGTAASGTNILTFAAIPNGLAVGRVLATTTSIPANTTVTAIDTSANTIALSANTTGTISAGASINFGNEQPAYGASVTGLQTERCDTGIEIYNCVGGFISSNHITVSDSSMQYSPITGMSYSATAGGTISCTTPSAHHIPNAKFGTLNGAGTCVIQFNGAVNFAWGQAINFIRTATIDSSTTFHFSGIGADPGSPPATDGSGNKMYWAYPGRYGYRCRKVYETVIASTTFTGGGCNNVIGNMDLDYDGEAEHRNNTCIGIFAEGYGWKMPSNNAKTLAGWRFINCTGNASPAPANASAPTTSMNFADLPGQSGVFQPGPFDGQEYDIVNCNVAAASNFGTTAAGGGTNHVHVRYDSSGTPGWRITG